MPPTRLNFARMFSSTTGTGNLSLTPVVNRPTFNQSLGVASGTYTEFKYTVIEPSTGAYEIGTCTYNAATSTISARVPIESWSGSGNIGTGVINFGPSVFVYCGVYHQDIITIDEAKTQGFSFTLETPENNKEYVITSAWPIDVNCTITNITVQAESGTATLNMKINGTSITGASAIAASSSEASVNPSAANVLAQGDAFSVLCTSVTAALNVVITVRYQRA